jgi:hypothetical protein
MYSLVWQSVIWRPGKLRFLIGVNNPLPIPPPRPPANAPLCRAAPFAGLATESHRPAVVQAIKRAQSAKRS